VLSDLSDPSRLSWAGVAHEIREILAQVLRILAPDSEILKAKWYEQELGTTGPTHRQRARFILEKRNAGSREREVTEKVGMVEDQVANLVRSTYMRASDAAHRDKERAGAYRISLYFEAFAFDILDLS
jgi:repressor of nif and glnA expression